MGRLQMAWKCASYSLNRLRSKPIVLALIIFMALYSESILSPFRQFAADYYIKINALGLFVYMMSDMNFVLVSGICLLVLLGDAPFADEATQFVLLRSGQRVWLWGQVLYVLIATAVYLVFLFVVQFALLLPHVYIGSEWGRAINTFVQTNTAAGYQFTLYFDPVVQIQFSPTIGFALTSIFRWLAFTSCALLLFAINMCFHTKAGMLAAFAVLLLDLMISMFFPYSYYIVSISSLARPSIMNAGYNPYYPSIKSGAVMLCSCFILLMVLVQFIGRMRDIEEFIYQEE